MGSHWHEKSIWLRFLLEKEDGSLAQVSDTSSMLQQLKLAGQNMFSSHPVSVDKIEQFVADVPAWLWQDIRPVSECDFILTIRTFTDSGVRTDVIPYPPYKQCEQVAARICYN